MCLLPRGRTESQPPDDVVTVCYMCLEVLVDPLYTIYIFYYWMIFFPPCDEMCVCVFFLFVSVYSILVSHHFMHCIIKCLS